LRNRPPGPYTQSVVKVTARLVALVVLVAFALGPALACYALPAAAGASSDECCRMMAGACASKTTPASAPRSCCHPDNLGDRAYVRSSAATTAAPALTTLVALVLPAAEPFIARAASASVVCSHAPPGRLGARLSALRI
jgi:hypothetical protein